jgi:hypothetical protein
MRPKSLIYPVMMALAAQCGFAQEAHTLNIGGVELTKGMTRESLLESASKHGVKTKKSKIASSDLVLSVPNSRMKGFASFGFPGDHLDYGYKEFDAFSSRDFIRFFEGLMSILPGSDFRFPPRPPPKPAIISKSGDDAEAAGGGGIRIACPGHTYQLRRADHGDISVEEQVSNAGSLAMLDDGRVRSAASRVKTFSSSEVKRFFEQLSAFLDPGATGTVVTSQSQGIDTFNESIQFKWSGRKYDLWRRAGPFGFRFGIRFGKIKFIEGL